jgi:Tol biopolymer transport system component
MERFRELLFIISVFGILPTIPHLQNVVYDYYRQTPPGDTPKIFAPGIVSVDNKNSHALVVSPDGKMIIFSRYPDGTSYILSKANNEWTGPVESFFYGKEVSFSPDGNKIFYYTGGDIFYVEKKSSGWSQPIKLGTNVNTTNQTEYYPSIIKSGDLYFSRAGDWATGRLMYSKFQNGEFQKAVDLGLPINNGGALHAWFSPDESYVLFNSPRAGSYTRNDIWISFKKKDGNWTDPINLGKKINSGADAIMCPTVSPDGKYMFFTKLNFNPTTGFIYWVSTSFIDSLRTSAIDTQTNKKEIMQTTIK